MVPLHFPSSSSLFYVWLKSYPCIFLRSLRFCSIYCKIMSFSNLSHGSSIFTPMSNALKILNFWSSSIVIFGLHYKLTRSTTCFYGSLSHTHTRAHTQKSLHNCHTRLKCSPKLRLEPYSIQMTLFHGGGQVLLK